MATDPATVKAILHATTFAASKHTKQRRRDQKTPYINHPIAVANLIVTLGGVTNVEIIQAALLHDTVEDTATTFDEIEKNFGKVVRDYVYEVTDPPGLSKVGKKLHQIDNKYSYGARVVKLADKLHNLSDLIADPPAVWDLFGTHGYTIWCAKVVAGMKGTNKGLEDALADLFKKRFVKGGQEYPVIPEIDTEEYLKRYYEVLSR